MYVPNGGKDFQAKLRFLEALDAWARSFETSGRRLVLCGDLNVALTDRDVHEKERKATAIGQLPEERALIQGDARCHAIAAASILAKVARDECMRQWDAVFPQYGLAQHKGYSTPEHSGALSEHGPSPLHRQSFAPVRSRSLFRMDPEEQTRLFDDMAIQECL